MLNIAIPVRNDREGVGPLFDKFVSGISGFDQPYRINTLTRS